jgi:type II secretory pathway component PulK
MNRTPQSRPLAPQGPAVQTCAASPNDAGNRALVPRLRPSRRERTTLATASRRGLVLILVLIAIAMLSLGAYAFTDWMLAHHEAALHTSRQVQTRALVASGVESVRVFLSLPPADRDQAGGTFDNPERFRGVNIVPSEDPRDRGSFSVLAPSLDSYGDLSGVRNGLEDESTRLNLNTLLFAEQLVPDGGRQLLMALPGMTEDVADAILDWLDADEEEREFGAESGYYAGLGLPYGAKNGPVETVEELLLVRGVTPQLLFGADINRNGQLDSHESFDPDLTVTDPSAFRGWSAFLTLHSKEWNVTPDGQPRIYLNNNDLTMLHEQLSEVFPPEWVTFIIAYRLSGPAGGGGNQGGGSGGGRSGTGNQSGSGGESGGANRSSGGGGGGQTGGQTGGGRGGTGSGGGAISGTPQENVVGELDLTQPPQATIAQVLDLIDAQVQYTFPGDIEPTLMASPFKSDPVALNVYLPELLDYVTVNPAATIPGRININQAPQTILLGIPGMLPEVAEEIVARRSQEQASDNASRRHETWLLQEGLVTLEEMKTMMPFVTSGGSVYRAQIVGYFEGGQAASRAEVIFDATSPLPRVLFWRDLSHLGRGYAVETLGVGFNN